MCSSFGFGSEDAHPRGAVYLFNWRLGKSNTVIH